MKILLLFLFIGLYSFGQNKPKVIAIDPQIMEEKAIAKSDIVEFPDEEATFPCHTFYNYDTLGNVISDYERCGANGMMTYIYQNVVYPQNSIEMNQQGRVFLSFVVETDGSITNVVVERGVSVDLDREAKRVLRKMPKWIPAKSGGKLVRCRARLPINFQLN
jgi:TonB family protein